MELIIFWGEISNFVRLHQLHSRAGKTKIAESSRPIWAWAFNKGRQLLPQCGARSPYYLFSWQYTYIITVPTCDPIVFGLLHMSQLLPLLCGGEGNQLAKIFSITVKYRSVKFRSTDRRNESPICVLWQAEVVEVVHAHRHAGINTKEILTGTCTFVTWPKLGKDKRKWILFVVGNQLEQK